MLPVDRKRLFFAIFSSFVFEFFLKTTPKEAWCIPLIATSIPSQPFLPPSRKGAAEVKGKQGRSKSLRSGLSIYGFEASCQVICHLLWNSTYRQRRIMAHSSWPAVFPGKTSGSRTARPSPLTYRIDLAALSLGSASPMIPDPKSPWPRRGAYRKPPDLRLIPERSWSPFSKSGVRASNVSVRFNVTFNTPFLCFFGGSRSETSGGYPILVGLLFLPTRSSPPDECGVPCDIR